MGGGLHILRFAFDSYSTRKLFFLKNWRDFNTFMNICWAEILTDLLEILWAIRKRERILYCVSFIRCPRGFRSMDSLANLSNMHSQKFSAFRWVSVEKRDHESFQAWLRDCPSDFGDEIFHRLSNRKDQKRDSFLACDSAFVRGVGAKKFHQKNSLPFFKTHLASYLNGV